MPSYHDAFPLLVDASSLLLFSAMLTDDEGAELSEWTP